MVKFLNIFSFLEVKIMKKRILSVLFTGMLILSVAACNNGNSKDNSSSSTSENSNASSETQAESSKTDEVELDEKIRDSVESTIGTDVLGNKTKTLLNKFVSDELDISLSMEIPKTEESSQSAVSLPEGSSISIGYAKNADNAARIKVNLAGIKMDMLQNSDGSYILNEDSKTALFTKTEEQSSNVESSLDTSSDLSSNVYKDMIKNDGEGEEKFGDKTYSYEAYTLKYDVSSSLGAIGGMVGSMIPSTSDSSDSSDVSANKEYTLKLFFDGDDIKGISIDNGESKVELNIDKFETKADASLFTVPSDYEITESASGNMLGGLFGNTTSMPEATE